MKIKKISVNTPLSHCDAVRYAIGHSGGGKIGKYEYCSFSIRGVGRSKPMENSQPYIGIINSVSSVEEEKIESFCFEENLEAIVTAIKSVHPYEEPAITV